MKRQDKPTYEQLESRLAESEGAMDALRGHEADAIIGSRDVCLIRLRQIELELKEAHDQLQIKNEELEGKVRRRTEELARTVVQLQHLTVELSEAEDRERRRLAEILHNDLQQLIVGARFHLQSARSRMRDDATVVEAMREVDQILKNAIAHTRGLSHQLSPAALEQGGLCTALATLADEFESLHGFRVELMIAPDSEPKAEAVKSFIYKAAQELLLNAVKHSGVKEARVHLRKFGPHMHLVVSDRGRGFDAKAISGHFGLFSIRQRAEILGGALNVDSAPKEGSTFTLILPDRCEADSAKLPADRIAADHIARTQAAHAQAPARPIVETPSAARRPAIVPVLLVDDHPIVRDGLMSLLNDQPDLRVVATARNGREALNACLKLRPQVVIMDVAMLVMDGEEATRQIKARLPETRIIGLSLFDDDETAQRMLAAGAEAYVCKADPSAKLLTTIRSAATAAR